MIAYGIINQVFDLGMTKGAVGWWQIIGAAAGFLFSREYAEPHLRIPFSKGTYEQKKKAVDAYLAEMEALDKHIENLQNMQGVAKEPEPQTLERTIKKDSVPHSDGIFFYGLRIKREKLFSQQQGKER